MWIGSDIFLKYFVFGFEIGFFLFDKACGLGPALWLTPINRMLRNFLYTTFWYMKPRFTGTGFKSTSILLYYLMEDDSPTKDSDPGLDPKKIRIRQPLFFLWTFDYVPGLYIEGHLFKTITRIGLVSKVIDSHECEEKQNKNSYKSRSV